MKYYFITIVEYYCEHESSSHYVLACREEELEAKLESISAGHKCGEFNDYDHRWWFDGFAHSHASACEITEEAFDVMKKYLTRI